MRVAARKVDSGRCRYSYAVTLVQAGTRGSSYSVLIGVAWLLLRRFEIRLGDSLAPLADRCLTNDLGSSMISYFMIGASSGFL